MKVKAMYLKTIMRGDVLPEHSPVLSYFLKFRRSVSKDDRSSIKSISLEKIRRNKRGVGKGSSLGVDTKVLFETKIKS